MLFEKLFPELIVLPFLMLIDKTKRTTLDGAPKLFDLTRHTRADGTEQVYAATFTGTREELAKLDVLTLVPAQGDVAVHLRASGRRRGHATGTAG